MVIPQKVREKMKTCIIKTVTIFWFQTLHKENRVEIKKIVQ